MSAISKTTITITVLHPSDYPMPAALDGVLYEMDQGIAVGSETARITEPMPANDVYEQLIALGNDGNFFDDHEDDDEDQDDEDGCDA